MRMFTQKWILLFAILFCLQGTKAEATRQFISDELFSLSTVGTLLNHENVSGGSYEAHSDNGITVGNTDNDPWTFKGVNSYVHIILNQALKIGDVICIKAKAANSRGTVFRVFNNSSGKTSSDISGNGAEISIGTTENVYQVVVEASHQLAGKREFWLRWSSGSYSATLSYVKVLPSNPSYASSISNTKSWNFTEYDVAGETSSSIICDNLYCGKGVSIINMQDYKETDQSSETSSIHLLNIPGNSGVKDNNTFTKDNGKYIMFYVPAGTGKVTLNVVPNGTSGKKTLCYQIGDAESTELSINNVKYSVERSFEYTAPAITPIYIYVGGSVGTFYIKDITLTLQTQMVGIGTLGYTTFRSACPLDFSSLAGLKAYIATGINNCASTVSLSQVTSVPANTGLILQGAKGNYSIPTEETTSEIGENLLVGTTADILLAASTDETTNYVLGTKDAKVSFYKVGETSAKVPAGHAYLSVPLVSAAKESDWLLFAFDDYATSIDAVQKQDSDIADGKTSVYSLSGQRVNATYKGIVIKNGKKFIQK